MEESQTTEMTQNFNNIVLTDNEDYSMYTNGFEETENESELVNETEQKHTEKMIKMNKCKHYLDLNHYYFTRNRVGLIVELQDNEHGINSQDVINQFSKMFTKLNLGRCTLFMFANDNAFKLFLLPKVDAVWIPTMLQYKTFITGILSTIPAEKKRVKLSNDKNEDQRHSLISMLYNMEFLNTTYIVIFGDDNCADYLYKMKCGQQIFKVNPFEQDSRVGLFVTQPIF